MHFLIIDDSVADARVLKAMLGQACPEGFEVSFASSGAEALRLLQNHEYDCLFLDYRLEDSAEWSVLRRIRELQMDIPIIAISGYGNEQVAVEGLKLGAQDYLVKDALTAETVHRALHNAIEKVTMTRNLLAQQKELRDFAHMAAHDLQAPLRRIAQLSEFLQEDLEGSLNEKSATHLEMIATNATRLQSLVKNLIDYARHGSSETPLREVSLQQVVAAAIQNLEVVIQEANAQVTVGEMPSIMGDEVMLILLFQNLVSNAIKFRDKRVPEIRINAMHESSQWTIEIADNGIGIAEKDIDTIFAPFKRLHSQREFEGSGIGLATCRKIVDQHQGKIWARSKQGEGTTLYVSFPDTVSTS
ncbi:ATP-binding protein [Bremerella sp. JC817]|uniref:sensor histidine kinase n=1 Tax=Bremerella sp. JC817 TaxID=3231756 RepID=UPI00345A2A48